MKQPGQVDISSDDEIEFFFNYPIIKLIKEMILTKSFCTFFKRYEVFVLHF